MLLYIREFGIIKTAKRAVLKGLALFFYYRREILFEKNINEEIRKINPKIEVKIRKATVKDAYLFEKDFSKSYKEDFLKRIRRDECFIALKDNNIAHIIWITYKDFFHRDIQSTLRVNKNESYIFDASTPLKFRGKGIYPAVIQYVLAYLKNKKIKKALISTASDNYPSLKGILKNKFRKINTAVYISVFNKLILKRDFEKKLKLYFN